MPQAHFSIDKASRHNNNSPPLKNMKLAAAATEANNTNGAPEFAPFLMRAFCWGLLRDTTVLSRPVPLRWIFAVL